MGKRLKGEKGKRSESLVKIFYLMDMPCISLSPQRGERVG
jgi:hypothetical protein